MKQTIAPAEGESPDLFSWRGLVGAAVGFAAANLFCSIATTLGNFASAVMLTPLEYGSVQTAFLLINYLWMLSLGVLQGFTQEYPMQLGAGRTEESNALARGAHSFMRLAAMAGMG